MINLSNGLAGLSVLTGSNGFAALGGGVPAETLAVRRARAQFTTPEAPPPWKAAASRTPVSAQVAADVRACLGDVVFATVIPRNVKLSEAPSHGVPALIYDHRCSGSEAYMGLAREMIARMPKPAAVAA